MARRGVAGMAVLLGMLFVASSAHAASIMVNTTADDAAADCTGGPCSLRGALAHAAGVSDPVVLLPSGTYTLVNGPLDFSNSSTELLGMTNLTSHIVRD